MRRRAVYFAGALVASATLGLGAVAVSSGAGAGGKQAGATLYSTSGSKVGRVTFTASRDQTVVHVHLAGAPGAADAFHGFHIHANNDSANGEGCVAPTFASADGHWRVGLELHGHHVGDMPSVYVNHDGSVDARFALDRIDLSDLPGRVVILHAGADNFNNVPVGTAPTEYTPNDPVAAPDLTSMTGNAGPRVACGVIR